MRSQDSRAGFTIIELIVVAVLGSLVVLASHRIMVNSLRAYTVVGARVQASQTVRVGADVMFGELREISPSGGDLLFISPDSVVIRSMRAFGIACDVGYTATPTLTVRRVGYAMQPLDSVFFFADNDTRFSDDDVWLAARIGAVDTTVACASGDAAQRITLPGMAGAMTADSVRTGAPVRTFEHFWYGLEEVEGEWYLARRGEDGASEPLVGPLLPGSSNGLQFEFLNALGAATNFRNQVAQIRVTLRSASSVTTSLGQTVADSLVASIYPRN
jgi:hypothetical protein